MYGNVSSVNYFGQAGVPKFNFPIAFTFNLFVVIQFVDIFSLLIALQVELNGFLGSLIVLAD